MLVDGYLRVGRSSAVELKLHWTLPLAALVFGSLRLEPIFWAAFFVLVVVHQLGHALLVKGLGFRIAAFELTGFGGQCRFRGKADALDQAIIAWGGVLAQLVVLIGALLVALVQGSPKGGAGALLEHAFIHVNLWLIGINLLPFAPLDGGRAWRLFPELTRHGWTLPRLLLYPLYSWADRRRLARLLPTEPSLSPNSSLSCPQPRLTPVPAVTDAADVDRDDDLVEKPSAQAQRELAALLERIGDEAARARKRR